MPNDPYELVATETAAIADVLNAVNVLTWDARVAMPAPGTEARSEQIATLSAVARGKLLDPRLSDAVAAARDHLDPEADDVRRRELDAVASAIEHHARLPDALMRRHARAKGTAQSAWAAARAADDFGAFAPHLEEMLALKRELAAAIAPERPAYDALLHEYEPGIGTDALHDLFGSLRATLVPLFAAVREAPAPRTDFLRRAFDVDRQREVSLRLAERIGYETARGRLDLAPHPFEISFATNDVRITTRVDERFLPQSLFAALHEAGHGLYEQNADPAYARSALSTDLIGLYAVSGTSYGTHESQSRLWENLVGRSRPFWERHLPLLRDAFPGVLDDVDVDAFHRAVNAVAPSPIRVEADEVSYNLHVMLRVELELALLDGDLTVAELPDAWNERMERDLGFRPQDDREGVLQDIHWSAGLVGAFPTYTIGTVMASQWYEAALTSDPTLEADVRSGSYDGLRAWLTDHVCRHARRYEADELLRRATGRPLDPEPYLRYLTDKYQGLYGL